VEPSPSELRKWKPTRTRARSTSFDDVVEEVCVLACRVGDAAVERERHGVGAENRVSLEVGDVDEVCARD
jgi:hypothetical protein